MSDAWHCRWCGQAEVVPSLTVEHEAECVARPADFRVVA